MSRKVHLVDGILACLALPLAFGLVSCGAGDTDTSGSGTGNHPAPSNTGSKGAPAPTAGTGGSSSTGSGGSAPTGPTTGAGGSSAGAGGSSAGAGGSSAGAGGSVGGAGGSVGAAGAAGGGVTPIGWKSTPADDLPPPDPAKGIQFQTPDGAYPVQPGQEIFPNYTVTVPKDIQIGGYQSWMKEGSSHHFILYKGSAAGGQWMYATSTPGTIVEEYLPTGVGLKIAANTQLVLNMHFINTGTTVLDAKIKINVMFAENVQYQAGTMISFNTQINVPPHKTQTVTGTCTAPAGAKFYTMSTHTHKRATAAFVNLVSGGKTTEIVHTGVPTTGAYPANQLAGSGTDWEHPGIGYWTAPDFLTMKSGDSFTYGCSYQNDDDVTVTVGETAASNEMCMAVGYYFPAGSASCR